MAGVIAFIVGAVLGLFVGGTVGVLGMAIVMMGTLSDAGREVGRLRKEVATLARQLHRLRWQRLQDAIFERHADDGARLLDEIGRAFANGDEL